MELNDVRWRKSSRSGDNGGNCVELAVWRTSSRSGDNGGHCVQVAALPVAKEPAKSAKSGERGRS